MNILHVTGMPFPTKFGSLEQWFAEICRQAASLGDSVYVAYSQHSDNVEIYNHKIHECGGRLIVLKDDNAIEAFCNGNNIDILHLHFSFCGYKALYRRLKNNGVRLFVHYHGENVYYANSDWRKNLKSWIRINGHRVKMRYTAHFIEKFLGCSNIVAHQHKTFYYLPAAKVSVHYLGISRAENTACDNNYSVPTITCTAFHSPIKGVDILLQALAILNERGISFRLVQIGGGSSELSGEDTTELKKICDDLGLTDKVHWTGVINNVKEYLRKTDIYCQPSRSEAISLSIAEAMQYGIPIVATNVGGVSELVHNGENGFLVEPEDPEALADKLQVLLDNKEMRNSMGAYSKSILDNLHFYQDKSVSKLFELYHSK